MPDAVPAGETLAPTPRSTLPYLLDSSCRLVRLTGQSANYFISSTAHINTLDMNNLLYLFPIFDCHGGGFDARISQIANSLRAP